MTDRASPGESSGQSDLGDIDFDITPANEPSAPHDVLWQQDAERARREALASVQRSAERWGATILAVTGLLASVTAIQGTRDLAQISDTFWKVSGGVVTGLALVIAAISVVLAAFAAQGKAVKIVPTGPELRRVSEEQAAKAQARLKKSRVAASLVIPLYILALAIVTYAPREPASKSVLVTLSNGSAICGSDIKMQERDFAISSPTQHARSIPFAQVVSVNPNSSCTPKRAAD